MSEATHDLLAETINFALAGERDQRDLPCLPRLEAHGSPRWNVEPHATRLFTLEDQPGICLEEMVVTADLHRAIEEAGGPTGPEPTRFGDWEKKGLAVDF